MQHPFHIRAISVSSERYSLDFKRRDSLVDFEKNRVGFYLNSQWDLIKSLFGLLLEGAPMMLEERILELLGEDFVWKIVILLEVF